MAKESLLNKLIEGTQNINRFHLYTSCEAYGKQAEYIRDGLKWDIWTKHFERICSEARIEGPTYDDDYKCIVFRYYYRIPDWVMEMKRKYGLTFRH